MPTVDLVEVGAGGGSVAWVDRAGGLNVGPRSAGAVPGPACYGRGGREPTLTDAYLVLGRLSPASFLGGRMKVFPRAAERAVREGIAEPLGTTVAGAAQGILKVAEASMVAALRRLTVAQGRNPERLALVAFGGAGPTQALSLAREMRMREVLIPPQPGVASALGLLITDLRYEFADTVLRGLDELEPGALERRFRRLEARARRTLRDERIPPRSIRVDRSLDARYRGQAYELGLRVPRETLERRHVRDITRRFHLKHRHTYGYAARGEAIEVVALRVSGSGGLPRPSWPRPPSARTRKAVPRRTRDVYFEGFGPRKTAVYDREDLRANNAILGPAVIEQYDTTTVVEPGMRASVDRWGNLRVRLHARP